VYKATSKDLIEDVPEGTVYFQQAGGGGGYGDAFARPPERVRKDVRNGVVSVEKARSDYGVIIRPETMELDPEATARLRSSRKEDG